MNWLFKWEEQKKIFKDMINVYQIPLDKIALSFSGGKDSVVMYKLFEELGVIDKINVVFSNTKMEFDATYEHIKNFDNIIILENNAALPLIYKEYGLPLHSKYSSSMIERLQQHNFNFKEDTYKSFDELYAKYPNCKCALRWLTGEFKRMKCPNWLKKELVNLDFKVSGKCCNFLKKKPFAKYNKENKIQMNIIGVRKAEGGIRSISYKKCFFKKDNVFKYLPLLNFTDDDISEIIKAKDIKLSKAYTHYKCDRTGCVGCPFSPNWKSELETLETYEPKKAVAVKNLYSRVYEIYKRKNKKE